MSSKNTERGKDLVKEPQVFVYPVFTPQTGDKSFLLCHARGMFPDLVRFTWQAKDQSQQNVDLRGDEQLEQRDEHPEVQITSMLIVEKHKAKSNNFICSVKHDSSVKDKELNIPTEKDISELNTGIVSTCPPQKAAAEEEEEEEDMYFGVFEHSRSLYLFSVTYVILLVKNMLYFCTVSVLLFKRNPVKI
ncbi:hypothetical protein AMELA_G00069210 [Ameiurus melas]|uniref:Ig-like domain-containing protein n=1 Tax=Ameiurus melas TaxID=219545 RepID=A0A7J6B6I3_AMEME|nr:hypothetical protein AMELA_G00069210 [Ameiurus melas]